MRQQTWVHSTDRRVVRVSDEAVFEARDTANRFKGGVGTRVLAALKTRKDRIKLHVLAMAYFLSQLPADEFAGYAVQSADGALRAAAAVVNLARDHGDKLSNAQYRQGRAWIVEQVTEQTRPLIGPGTRYRGGGINVNSQVRALAARLARTHVLSRARARSSSRWCAWHAC